MMKTVFDITLGVAFGEALFAAATTLTAWAITRRARAARAAFVAELDSRLRDMNAAGEVTEN